MKITAPQKETKDCFKNFGWRDDMDTLLPITQKAQKGEVSVIQLETEMTFLEMAQKYIGSTDPKKIKKHTLTLPMVEVVIEYHSDKLRTDGWGNLAFVENSDGSVSVLNVGRSGGRWHGYVYRLDGGSRWSAEDRLLLRSSDTTTPGSSETVLPKKLIINGVEYIQ